MGSSSRTSRSRLAAGLLALATVLAGLTVAWSAAPAQAAYLNVSGLTRYHLCKELAPSGRSWIVVSRVRKRSGSEDARAGVLVRRNGERGQRWSSGWLQGRQLEQGHVRVRRARQIRLVVWQEAGDTESQIGTALERRVVPLYQVAGC